MKNILPLIFSLLFVTSLFSQEKIKTTHTHKHGSNHHTCGFDHKLNELEKKHPELIQIHKEYVSKIIPQLVKERSENRSQAVLNVPVVFHVIHNGESEGTGQNISDQRIFDQLATLNEDFAALNADFAQTPARFADAIGNPEINFCLAVVDPQGNPTNGITRHQFSNTSDANVESVIKPSTSWDPFRYYNIWTLAIPGTSANGGVTGYAYLPYNGTIGNTSTDGSVLDYRFTGGGESTLTHETGHYLGLFHTWGSGGCNADDGFSDTPDQAEATSDSGWFSCANNYPPGPNSCGEEHMYVNYMDYASETCSSSFTNQQIAVMRAVLQGTTANPTSGPWGSRAGLLSAANSVASCDNPGGGGGGGGPVVFNNDVGVVEIISPSGTACGNGEITPVIELQNQFGENNLTSARIRYRYNGTNGPNFNWTGNLPKGATETVTLPSFTAPDAGFTFEVTVSNPNNQPDEWGFNDEEEVTVGINNPQPAPLLEDFESINFEPTPSGLTTINFDNDPFTWQLASFVSGYGVGTGCVYFNNFEGNPSFNPEGTSDALVTPPLDFTNIENAELTFDVAHAPYSIQYVDGLEVRISTDCGSTYSDQVYFKEGDELNTTGGYLSFFFSPTMGQWRTETIDLSAYNGMETVSISFINHSGYGNSIYLDNINIGTGCSASVSFESENITCSDACDGSIDLNISGFEETYTVTWSDNIGSQESIESASNLCADNYNVTVTDGDACQFIETITLTQPAGVETSGYSLPETFFGGNDGQGAVYGFSEDISDFTYTWSNGASTPVLTNLAPGTYYVTITADGLPCPKIDSLVIEPYDCSAFIGTITTQHATCNGAFDGQVSVDIDGGVTPYFYEWSNNFIGASHSNFAAGEYTVTVTDRKNCVYIETVLIEEPDPLSVEVEITPETAFESADAAINVIASGGNPDYTYNWSNQQSGATIQNLIPSTYTLTVTDANECTLVETITIDAIACSGIELLIETTDVNCNGDSNGSAELAVFFVDESAGDDYTILWSNGSSDVNIDNLSAGNYSVEAFYGGGCSEIAEVTIEEPDEILVNTTLSNESFVNGNDGSIELNIEGGSGDYSYEWSNEADQAAINGLAPATYTVTITDTNGCSTIEMITIEAYDCGNFGLDNLVINTTCYGELNGGATVGANEGTEPYAFEWSNESTTNSIENVAAGDYTLTVTDASGCADIMEITIPNFEEITLTVEVTAETEEETNDGTIIPTASPDGNYTYTLLNETGETIVDFENLEPGIYSVTAIDNENGCTVTEENIVVDSAFNPCSSFSLNSQQIEVACFGENTGSIELILEGGEMPYTILWDNDATTSMIENLGSGIYEVTISDAIGCSFVQNFEITEPNPLTLELAGINETYQDFNDGAVDLSVDGGVPPYSYEWSNESTEEDLENLSPDTYQIVVTDANGCSTEGEVVIEAGINPCLGFEVEFETTNATCNGSQDGSISLLTTNGNAPFTYTWSNDATESSIEGLSAGMYEVLIEDELGCSTNLNIMIDEPNPIVIEATVNNQSAVGVNDGSISLEVFGDAALYNYEWSNEENNFQITNLEPGTYSVTVSDNLGCSTEATYEIISFVDLCVGFDVALEAQNISCNGAQDGSITSTISSGTGPFIYNWSNDVTESADLTNLDAGQYQLILSDVNGCSAESSIAIFEPEPIEVFFTVEDQTSTNSMLDGAIDLEVTGGVEPYTYEWSNNADSQDINELAGGEYSITITDANECTYIETVLVGILEPDCTGFEVSFDVTDVSCMGESDGAVNIIPMGGMPPYEVEWQNPLSGLSQSNLSAGAYLVVTTDAFGCSNQSEIMIESPEELEVVAIGSNGACGQDGFAQAIVSGGTAPYSYNWSNGETTSTISDVVMGMYIVSITDDNGCITESFVEIGSETEVTEFMMDATSVSCNGGSDGAIDLEPMTTDIELTYAWNTGASTSSIENLEPGVYTVFITDEFGCNYVISQTINEPLALMGSILIDNNDNGFDSAVCIVEGGTPPYQYQWSDGSTGVFVEGTDLNNYTTTVTDAMGCSTVAIVNLTSSQEIEIFNDVAIFPNPTTRFLQIEANVSISEKTTLQLYNLLGQTVMTETFEDSTISKRLDVSNLSQGTYFLQLSTSKGQFTSKVLIMNN